MNGQLDNMSSNKQIPYTPRMTRDLETPDYGQLLYEDSTLSGKPARVNITPP